MADFAPRMPEVDVVPDLEGRFAEARRMIRAVAGGRHIAVVTPGRMIMLQPCPPAGSIAPDMVAAITRLTPAEPPLEIAVIAMTELDAVRTNLASAIPFAGYLLGMGYLGHTVTVFEGHPSALAAGCRDADLLLVDGAMLPFLQRDWATVARGAMRGPGILLVQRDGQIQQIVARR